MMFIPTEIDEEIMENMQRDGELLSESSNLPFFSVPNNNNRRRKKPLLSDPPEGVSLQSSEFSRSSSSLNGFWSSPSRDDDDDLSGLWFLGSKSHHDVHNVSGNFVDELGLSRCFNGLNIRGEQDGGKKMMKGFEMGFDDTLQCNGNKYGSNNDIINGGCHYYDDVVSGIGSYAHGNSNTSCVGADTNGTFRGFQGGFQKGFCDSRIGNFLGHNLSDDLCSGSVWFDERRGCLLDQRKNHKGSVTDDALTCFHQSNWGRSKGGYKAMDPLCSPQSMHHPILDSNCHNSLYKSSMLKQRIPTTNIKHGIPQSLVRMRSSGDTETYGHADSFIVQGKGFNHGSNKGHNPVSGHGMNSFENDRALDSYCPLPLLPNIGSSGDIQGHILAMACDHNGCWSLQRIFDEGTSQDVDMIFSEIISHVVELMLNPFGNYVIQKLLEVCTDEQRFQIVILVTKEPRKLVGICSNTYGTRVIQKLIETVRTRQEISLLILALKPGFLDLIKDQNGNHVIQRCLQCLNVEDNEFIFNAAAKFCVEVATHRHGCCVMQQCIALAMGKHRDTLIAQVSKNSLLLAQDPFGNYVVQYVIELENLANIRNMLSRFKGHYVHLSMQKFSSHVVEKCLRHFEESRTQIIHELLSVSHFEQLMQDPYANYVIQSALAATKGPLNAALVEAVKPHVILRTSPFCKRIFSRNLLKK